MKLGIIGSGMIVNDLLSFVESIENIELVAILGREKSREKIEKIVNLCYNRIVFTNNNV